MTVTILVAVFVGGGCGALGRWLCGVAERNIRRDVPRPSDGWGTTAANVLACLFLGVVVNAHGPIEGEKMQALLAAGLCGGLSTFSSFALEVHAMVAEKRWRRAFSHVSLNLVGGAVAFAVASVIVG
ncbi:fluoride efflux transporter FluC [Timonella sp. A28]|uniref:fluoride efflux transporter FluC n=1 Tax=Timonella sp. A28 TaxID=3442640 RepID=UPI003EBDFF38